MKWYLNMKIGSKLILGFLLVALLCAAMGIYAVINLESIENSDTELHTNMLVPIEKMAGISESFQRQRVNIREAIIRDDPALVEAQIQKIYDRRKEIDALTIEFEESILSDEMHALFDEFLAAKEAYRPLLDQAIAMIESGDKEGAAALIAEEGAAGMGSRTEQNAINKVLDHKVADGERKSAQNTELANNAIMVTIIIICVVLIISILIGIWISRIVSKPIKATTNCAKELAAGNLDVPLNIKLKDEAGQLASIIDKEVRQAFKNIEQARVISDKQSKYSAEHVDKLVVNLERLARGELFCDMTVAEADEEIRATQELFTNISNHLNDSINNIKTYIDEISNVLGDMSSGNLAVEIKSEFNGDFVELKNSINTIIDKLNIDFVEINTSAEQVASGTQQVSDGSQEISQGATEQASSIEELSASVTQIAAQTTQNAANANEANELSIKAKNDAVDGNDKMNEMLESMKEINESSVNISKIIKVIDDIAFQTNILALNAAVEAARAGVHGKGFAVVAEEVRNLAARSADAAKETTALIEGSMNKVDAGTKIANETAQALANIVTGVEKAVELVGQIATASNEQASGVAQVNKGIEQLSQVVQTNSATAEESAAASEELSSQAELLKNMVGRIKLKNTISEINKSTEMNAIDYAQKNNEATIIDSEKPMIVLNDNEFGKY